jgi:alkylation response protein AidB-like acyl-CoA dehydrogenase
VNEKAPLWRGFCYSSLKAPCAANIFEFALIDFAGPHCPDDAFAEDTVAMAAAEADRVSEYLEAIRRLAPLIAANRGAFDRDRRLTDSAYAALAEAGLFRLWLPRSLGGPELTPIEFMRVVEAAAALDGSIGWLVGNGGGMSRVGGYLPAAVVRDWFADPRTFIASTTGAVGALEVADGGYRASGRWPFGSGAPHATHFMGLATIGGSQAPDQPRLCCYFSREQVTVHDTWHVSGLRGTGSSDFEARSAFVPTSNTHPFLGLVPTEPGLLYRMPPLSVFAWTVSVVPLGIARGVIDAFVQLASSKARLGTSGLLRDRETVQATVGRAETTLMAARAYLIEAMSELMTSTEIGGDRLVQARARLRVAGAHAAESACTIVDRLAAEAGSIAIFETCPLERAVRDVHAAIKHVAVNPSSYIIAGRMALGVDAGPARF